MKQKEVSRTIISLIVVFSLLLQIFLILENQNTSIYAQPLETDNGDFTITAIWDFSDPSYFNLKNTTIQNNAVNLSLETLYWNQSSKGDFDSGSYTDTNSTPAGDVILGDEMKTINIISNGDFITSSDWLFQSAEDMISSHNSSDQSAELGYSYKIGAKMMYLEPPTGQDDGHITYWPELSFFQNGNSSDLIDIGYRFEGSYAKRRRAFFYFDLSEIPVTSIINNVSFYSYLQTASANATYLFDVHAMDIPRSGAITIDIFIDCNNGSLYIDDSDSMKSGTPVGYYEWDLGALGTSDIQNNLSRGWFGIGIHEEGDDDERARLTSVNAGTNHPQLNISYDAVAPVTIDEIAYVNQTFNKPNVTPNNPTAANLNFQYKVDKFLNCTTELIIKIDGNPVWGPFSVSSTTGWTTVSVDVGTFMTASGNYEISLQSHMTVSAQTHVEGAVKYDNVNLTTLGYAWLGDYVSQEFNPGTDVFWDEISWTHSDDSETNLTIRTRNSQDGFTWDPWSYEYSNPTGDQISSNIGKKIQFSTNLSTTDYVKTPVLSDVSISYQKYYALGSIVMNSDYEPENLLSWGTWTWIEQANGQSLTYWYSTDSGSSWNQTLDGNLTGVSTSSGKIKFKTHLISTNGTITPSLIEWNLTYEVTELAKILGDINPGVGYIDTWYNFTVRYSDPANNPPMNITLNITSGTSYLGSYEMFEVDSTDSDFINGKWYYFNATGFSRGSNYTFHFAAKDSDNDWNVGDHINGPFVLNSPPKITSENKYGAQGDLLYYNDYEATDLEDEASLLWSLETNATWLSTDPVTGNLSGTPPPGDDGSYWINVKVEDGNSGSDEKNFTLIVGDTQPPLADAGSDQVVYEDDLVYFDGTNSTDNIGIINYTWDFGGFKGYGSTTSFAFSEQGIYNVALTVKDIIDNEDLDFVQITVLNRPPLADAGPDVVINEGDEMYFNASGSTDTPSDIGSLIYLWDFDEDNDFNDRFGINVTYAWFGPKTVTAKLRVIDNNGDYTEDSVVVQVNNIAPNVDIEDYYGGEKGSEIIIIAIYDHPGDTELQFRWDWENDGIWDTNRTSYNIVYHTWDEEGQYTLVVEVWDGTESTTDSAQVEITRHNNPPQLGDLGHRQIRYNTPFKIDLAQFITDEDNPLSDMIVTTDDNEHISINGVEITLIYPQNMIGQTVDVQVIVSDGLASDNSILTVQITQNYPPTLKEPFPDVFFDEDGEAKNVFKLNEHFEDLDSDKLVFEFISTDPNLIVEIDASGSVTFKTTPNWARSAMVRFRATDPSGAYTDEMVIVTVNPINDPPIIINQITSTTIGEDGNWTIDLDLFFLDVDSFNLTFTSNYPEIKIDPVTHEAVWVPGDKKQLEGVKFTANDGEHNVSLDPVDLQVVEQNPINWILIIPLIIAFIVVFIAYREMYYRYTVEEVFLVDNAGVLLVHISQWESKAIDVKLVSGMLTAVQEFVKDSFRGGNGGPEIKMDEGALGKLEYGDFQIVLERGSYTFLSAVISGNDNKRLRKRMKDVVDEFETKYSAVLADWDGDMARFDGAERIVGRLLKNHAEMKITSEGQIEEIKTENVEDEGIMDIPDLPSGDFADVPSYYDEINGGEFNENEDSK